MKCSIFSSNQRIVVIKGWTEKCSVLKAVVCLWKKVYWKQFELRLWEILELWLSFNNCTRIKMYKIIYLKEEGYYMHQIPAKILCGLSTVVRNLKRFSETNSIADRCQSGRPRETSLREEWLLHRISLSNKRLN